MTLGYANVEQEIPPAAESWPSTGDSFLVGLEEHLNAPNPIPTMRLGSNTACTLTCCAGNPYILNGLSMLWNAGFNVLAPIFLNTYILFTYGCYGAVHLVHCSLLG